MFLRITKKILFSIIIILLLSTPAKASHPAYSYDTAGEYRWYKNGNYLVNDVDAYKDKKSTKLSIFYNNPVKGVMYTGDEDLVGKDTKLGNFTAYVLSGTSNNQNSSDFSINGVGTYYALFNEDTKKVHDIVYIPNPVPYAYVNRYKFWIGGDEAKKVYFLHGEGGGDNWYGDYLAKIGKDVKDKKPGLSTISNPPQPPASSGSTGALTPSTSSTTGSTGTTAGECGTIEEKCQPKKPTTWGFVSKADIPTVSETLKKGNIATAWALSLDLVNVLAIFVLLAIAFANILHIGEREMFSFKRMIPAFVIGLIAANFSHLICRAIIDFAGMLMNFFVPKEHAVDVAANIYTGMYGGWTGATGGGMVMFAGLAVAIVALFLGQIEITCGILIIGLIILGIPVLISLILWFMLAARTYILWLLVILSPIAFFGMFFDPLKRTIEKWWGWFLPWTFMGPIAYFFIYLAEGFAKDTTGTNTVTGCFDPSNADQVGGFTKYLIVNALLILAVYVPYALGKKIGMELWAGIGKFLGATGAKLGFGAVGGTMEKIGQKKGWKRLQGLGKSVRQVPYLPEAVFGKEGMLAAINKANVGEAQRGVRKSMMRLPFGIGRGILNNWRDDAANAMDRSKDNIWARGLYNKQFDEAAPQVLASGLRDIGKRGPQTVEERRAVGAILQTMNAKAGVDLNDIQRKENALAIARSSGAPAHIIARKEREYNATKKNMITFDDIYHGTEGSADHTRERLKKKGHDADALMEHLNGKKGVLTDEAKRAIETGDWGHFNQERYRDTGLDTLVPGGVGGAGGGVQRDIDEGLSRIPTQRVTP